DAVLAAGVRPTRYAEELLEIASELTSLGVASLAPGLASRPSLEVRLRALLDARSTRRRATRLEAGLTATGVLSLALPLAAMRPAERTIPLQPLSLAPAPVSQVAPSERPLIAKPSVPPPRAVAPIQSLGSAVVKALCVSDGGSHSNWNEERQGKKTWDV